MPPHCSQEQAQTSQPITHGPCLPFQPHELLYSIVWPTPQQSCILIYRPCSFISPCLFSLYRVWNVLFLFCLPSKLSLIFQDLFYAISFLTPSDPFTHWYNWPFSNLCPTVLYKCLYFNTCNILQFIHLFTCFFFLLDSKLLKDKNYVLDTLYFPYSWHITFIKYFFFFHYNSVAFRVFADLCNNHYNFRTFSLPPK